MSCAIAAIFKNNAGVGIPSIKISKITIYDNKNNIVAVKKEMNGAEISLTNQGEFPFSFMQRIDIAKKQPSQ